MSNHEEEVAIRMALRVALDAISEAMAALGGAVLLLGAAGLLFAGHTARSALRALRLRLQPEHP